MHKLSSTTSSITTAYEGRPGERVAQSGVYGVYYLDKWTHQYETLTVGGIFPQMIVGTTFKLHAEF